MKRQSKNLANLSLAVMGAGFAATYPFQGAAFGHLLHGGFEAGVVGGLADWFAVTALFRHPLNLPIPHTALLPKNRQKITKAIVHTLENDWLSKESIKEKIATLAVTDKIFDAVDTELKSEEFHKALDTFSLHIIENLESDKLVPILEKELKSYLGTVEMKSLVNRVIDDVLDKNYSEKAFDFLLEKVGEWSSKEEAKHKLGKLITQALENIEADGFMQFTLKTVTNMLSEDKLGEIVQKFLVQSSRDLRFPENKNREALLGLLHVELGKLKENPAFAGELDSWKNKLVDTMELGGTISTVLEQFKQKVISLIKEGTFTRSFLIPFLGGMISKLKNDPKLLASIDSWIQRQVVSLVEKNHSKIGKLVEENLNKLDNETLTEMIEDKIGRDLQWIRVNGAVCGFLIGLVLAGINLIF